jgi:hypothetical protein
MSGNRNQCWMKLLALAAVGVLLCGCPGPRTSPTVAGNFGATKKPPHVRDASDDFFEQGTIPNLRIRLSESQERLLREDARRYVRATLVENNKTEYADIAIKLKGAAGSFQELDGKPGFTLNVGKFTKGQRFHALEKFHLNNSVQDDSYLCEKLAGELFRDAGVPAARVTHARVWLNDRDLGLYVVKEGFDQGFLKRHFSDPTGNLYDGGFCVDIDGELEKDSGTGVADLSDVRSLREACQLEDPEQRWARIAERLDVEAFINFMALELMTCHWDGYTPNKNNYRIFFDPATKKAHFLPHGMDQMFQDPGYPLLQWPGSIVAAAVMQNPAWREQFRQRVKELLPQFSAEALQAKIDKLDKPLPVVFRAMGEETAAQHVEAVRQLKERVVARAAALREQITQPDPGPAPEPSPLEFNEEGVAEIADWYPHEPEDAKLEPIESEGGVQLLIEVGPGEHCLASWRQRVLLAQGKYRFEAKLKTEGVTAISDEKGSGAGLRISGANRDNHLEGDSDWQTLSYDFEIEEPQGDVELVAELRASKGKLWLQLPLRLVKIAPAVAE